MQTHLVGTCAGEVEGSARSVFVVSRTYLLFFQGVTIFRISLRRVNADAGLLSRLDLGRILFVCADNCAGARHTSEGGVTWRATGTVQPRKALAKGVLHGYISTGAAALRCLLRTYPLLF